MPYNTFPVYQPPYQMQNGLIFVQGEAGAKSYPVSPGGTVLLMDSEGDRFFLRSADGAGMPLPLRKFEFKEIKEQPQNSSNEDIAGLRKEIDEMKKLLEGLKHE